MQSIYFPVNKSELNSISIAKLDSLVALKTNLTFRIFGNADPTGTGEAMNLSDVKTKSQLSGKKWDKSSKNLTKYNLVKVEKIVDVVWMNLV
jgi:outer membrane protein OmpA-like peptidoglycan-associated protein